MFGDVLHVVLTLMFPDILSETWYIEFNQDSIGVSNIIDMDCCKHIFLYFPNL